MSGELQRDENGDIVWRGITWRQVPGRGVPGQKANFALLRRGKMQGLKAPKHMEISERDLLTWLRTWSGRARKASKAANEKRWGRK